MNEVFRLTYFLSTVLYYTLCNFFVALQSWEENLEASALPLTAARSAALEALVTPSTSTGACTFGFLRTQAWGRVG